MKKQLGVSLGGLIIFSFVLVFVALLGFKLFTPYMQFFTIQKTLRAVAANPEMKSTSPREIQKAFERYSMIDNITAISSADVEVTKDGNELILSASYSVKVPLVANVSLLLDFNPTSAAK